MDADSDAGVALGALVASVAGSLLWCLDVATVHVEDIGDVGLVSALRFPAFLGMGLMILGFTVAIRVEQRTAALALHLVVLVVALYGASALIEGIPRFDATWRHLGLTDHFRTGLSVQPEVDAYFNWPGFFQLSAFVSSLTGVDLEEVAAWAPVLFGVLYLPPLVMIARALTPNRQMQWLGVWFFYLANSVSQDYFAPQAFALFLHLVVVGSLLRFFCPPAVEPGRWLPGSARLAPAPLLRPRLEGRQRALLLGVLLASYAVMVPSHQLTPFATLGVAATLVVVCRCSARLVPIFMGVVLVGWLLTGAHTYLESNLASLTEEVGALGGTTTDNVSERLQGTEGHQLVIRLRLAVSLLLAGLAAVGLFRRLRRRAGVVAAAFLAAAPLPLAGLQSYGGEMVLRIYLFALPFAAFLAAAAILPSEEARVGRRTRWAVAAVGVLLVSGTLLTRYGNERAEGYTPADLAAVDALYAVAPRGSTLIAVTRNTPWKGKSYAAYDYEVVADLRPNESVDEDPTVREVEAFARRAPDRDAFVIVTPSQVRHSQLFGTLPDGAVLRVVEALRRSSRFEVVYDRDGAVIFEYRRAAP